MKPFTVSDNCILPAVVTPGNTQETTAKAVLGTYEIPRRSRSMRTIQSRQLQSEQKGMIKTTNRFEMVPNFRFKRSVQENVLLFNTKKHSKVNSRVFQHKNKTLFKRFESLKNNKSRRSRRLFRQAVYLTHKQRRELKEERIEKFHDARSDEPKPWVSSCLDHSRGLRFDRDWRLKRKPAPEVYNYRELRHLKNLVNPVHCRYKKPRCWTRKTSYLDYNRQRQETQRTRILFKKRRFGFYGEVGLRQVQEIFRKTNSLQQIQSESGSFTSIITKKVVEYFKDTAAGKTVRTFVILSLATAIVNSIIFAYNLFGAQTTFSRIMNAIGCASSLASVLINGFALHKIKDDKYIILKYQEFMDLLEKKMQDAYDWIFMSHATDADHTIETIERIDFTKEYTHRDSFYKESVKPNLRVRLSDNTPTQYFSLPQGTNIQHVKDQMDFNPDCIKLKQPYEKLIARIKGNKSCMDIGWEMNVIPTSGVLQNCFFNAVWGTREAGSDGKLGSLIAKDDPRKIFRNSITEQMLKNNGKWDDFTQVILPDAQAFYPDVTDFDTWLNRVLADEAKISVATAKFLAELAHTKIIIVNDSIKLAESDIKGKKELIKIPNTNKYATHIRIKNSHYERIEYDLSPSITSFSVFVQRLNDHVTAFYADAHPQEVENFCLWTKILHNETLNELKYTKMRIQAGDTTSIIKMAIKFGVKLASYAFAIFDLATDDSMKGRSLGSKVKAFRDNSKAANDVVLDAKEIIEEISHECFGVYLGDDCTYMAELQVIYEELVKYTDMPTMALLRNYEVFYAARNCYNHAHEVLNSTKLMTKELTEGTKNLTRNIHGLLTKLKGTMRAVADEKETSAVRQNPTATLVWGRGGAGKTVFINSKLIPEVCKELGIKNSTYTLSFKSDKGFYTPYSGQPMMIYDEFGALKAKDRILPDMNQLCSSGGFNMEGADIPHKVQPCNFKCMFLISNSPYIDLTNEFSDFAAQAFWTRLTPVLYVNCYQEPGDKRNSIKRGSHTDVDHYEYRLYLDEINESYMNIPLEENTNEGKKDNFGQPLPWKTYTVGKEKYYNADKDEYIYPETDAEAASTGKARWHSHSQLYQPQSCNPGAQAKPKQDLRYRLLTFKQLVKLHVNEYRKHESDYIKKLNSQIREFVEDELTRRETTREIVERGKMNGIDVDSVKKMIETIYNIEVTKCEEAMKNDKDMTKTIWFTNKWKIKQTDPLFVNSRVDGTDGIIQGIKAFFGNADKHKLKSNEQEVDHFVVCINGAGGSGKTYMARYIADKLGKILQMPTFEFNNVNEQIAHEVREPAVIVLNDAIYNEVDYINFYDTLPKPCLILNTNNLEINYVPYCNSRFVENNETVDAQYRSDDTDPWYQWAWKKGLRGWLYASSNKKWQIINPALKPEDPEATGFARRVGVPGNLVYNDKVTERKPMTSLLVKMTSGYRAYVCHCDAFEWRKYGHGFINSQYFSDAHTRAAFKKNPDSFPFPEEKSQRQVLETILTKWNIYKAVVGNVRVQQVTSEEMDSLRESMKGDYDVEMTCATLSELIAMTRSLSKLVSSQIPFLKGKDPPIKLSDRIQKARYTFSIMDFAITPSSQLADVVPIAIKMYTQLVLADAEYTCRVKVDEFEVIAKGGIIYYISKEDIVHLREYTYNTITDTLDQKDLASKTVRQLDPDVIAEGIAYGFDHCKMINEYGSPASMAVYDDRDLISKMPEIAQKVDVLKSRKVSVDAVQAAIHGFREYLKKKTSSLLWKFAYAIAGILLAGGIVALMVKWLVSYTTKKERIRKTFVFGKKEVPIDIDYTIVKDKIKEIEAYYDQQYEMYVWHVISEKEMRDRIIQCVAEHMSTIGKPIKDSHYADIGLKIQALSIPTNSYDSDQHSEYGSEKDYNSSRVYTSSSISSYDSDNPNHPSHYGPRNWTPAPLYKQGAAAAGTGYENKQKKIANIPTATVVTNSSIQKFGVSGCEIENLVYANIFGVMSINGVDTYTVHGIGIKERYILAPYHVYIPGSIMQVVHLKSKVPYDARIVVVDTSRDLMLLEIKDKKFPAMRDITKHFVEKKHAFTCCKTTFVSYASGRKLLSSGEGQTTTTQAGLHCKMPIGSNFGVDKGIAILVNHTMQSTCASYLGDCGLPIFGMINSKPTVMATHVMTTGNITEGPIVTQEYLEAFLKVASNPSVNIQALQIAGDTEDATGLLKVKLTRLGGEDPVEVIMSETTFSKTFGQAIPVGYDDCPRIFDGPNTTPYLFTTAGYRSYRMKPKHLKSSLSNDLQGLIPDNYAPSATTISQLKPENVANLEVLRGHRNIAISQAVKVNDHVEYSVMAQEYLTRSQQLFLPHYIQTYGKSTRHRYLTQMEMVNGTRINPREKVIYMNLESLNRDGSVGFDMTNSFPGLSTWEHILEKTEYESPNTAPLYRIKNNDAGRYLINQTQWQYCLAKNSVSYIDLVQDNVKVELRPQERVDVGNTRVFNSLGAKTTLNIRRVCGTIMAAFKHFHMHGHSMIGIRTEEFHHICERLRKVSSLSVCGDYKNYDKSITRVEWDLAVDTIIEIFSSSCHEQLAVTGPIVIRTLLNQVINSLSICDGLVYRTDHGNKSGNPLTTVINDICNLHRHGAVILYILDQHNKHYRNPFYYEEMKEWCESIGLEEEFRTYGHRLKDAIDTDLETINKNIDCISYGDDWLMTVSKEWILLVNFVSVSRTFKDIFGIEYTDPSKCPITEAKPYVPLDEAEFMSRTMSTRGRYTFPKLKLKTINHLFHWTTKDDHQQVRANIMNAFRELLLHDEETFNSYAQHIKAINDAALRVWPMFWEPIPMFNWGAQSSVFIQSILAVEITLRPVIEERHRFDDSRQITTNVEGDIQQNLYYGIEGLDFEAVSMTHTYGRGKGEQPPIVQTEIISSNNVNAMANQIAIGGDAAKITSADDAAIVSVGQTHLTNPVQSESHKSDLQLGHMKSSVDQTFHHLSVMDKAFMYQPLNTITANVSSTTENKNIFTLGDTIQSVATPAMQRMIELHDFIIPKIAIKVLTTGCSGITGSVIYGKCMTTATVTEADLDNAERFVTDVSQYTEEQFVLSPVQLETEALKPILSTTDFVKHLPKLKCLCKGSFMSTYDNDKLKVQFHIYAKFEKGTLFISQKVPSSIGGGGGTKPGGILNPNEANLGALLGAPGAFIYTEGGAYLEEIPEPKATEPLILRPVLSSTVSENKKGTMSGATDTIDQELSACYQMEARELKSKMTFTPFNVELKMAAVPPKDIGKTNFFESYIERYSAQRELKIAAQAASDENREIAEDRTYTSVKARAKCNLVTSTMPTTVVAGVVSTPLIRAQDWWYQPKFHESPTNSFPQFTQNEDLTNQSGLHSFATRIQSNILYETKMKDTTIDIVEATVDTNGVIRSAKVETTQRFEPQGTTPESAMIIETNTLIIAGSGKTATPENTIYRKVTFFNIPSTQYTLDMDTSTVLSVNALKTGGRMYTNLPVSSALVCATTRPVPGTTQAVVSGRVAQTIVPTFSLADRLKNFYDNRKITIMGLVDAKFKQRFAELIYHGPKNVCFIRSTTPISYSLCKYIARDIEIQGITQFDENNDIPYGFVQRDTFATRYETAYGDNILATIDRKDFNGMKILPNMYSTISGASMATMGAQVAGGALGGIGQGLQQSAQYQQMLNMALQNNEFRKEYITMYGEQALEQLQANNAASMERIQQQGKQQIEQIEEKAHQDRITMLMQRGINTNSNLLPTNDVFEIHGTPRNEEKRKEAEDLAEARIESALGGEDLLSPKKPHPLGEQSLANPPPYSEVIGSEGEWATHKQPPVIKHPESVSSGDSAGGVSVEKSAAGKLRAPIKTTKIPDLTTNLAERYQARTRPEMIKSMVFTPRRVTKFDVSNESIASGQQIRFANREENVKQAGLYITMMVKTGMGARFTPEHLAIRTLSKVELDLASAIEVTRELITLAPHMPYEFVPGEFDHAEETHKLHPVIFADEDPDLDPLVAYELAQQSHVKSNSHHCEFHEGQPMPRTDTLELLCDHAACALRQTKTLRLAINTSLKWLTSPETREVVDKFKIIDKCAVLEFGIKFYTTGFRELDNPFTRQAFEQRGTHDFSEAEYRRIVVATQNEPGNSQERHFPMYLWERNSCLAAYWEETSQHVNIVQKLCTYFNIQAKHDMDKFRWHSFLPYAFYWHSKFSPIHKHKNTSD